MRAIPRMKRSAPAIILGLAVLAPLSLAADGTAAPVARASEVIAEINALRAANGLTPFEVDPILMSVAEAHNNWRLAAGVTTHTGPDGSTPRQRAIAAGYGAGATVFISEIIADGLGLTPAGAVQWWIGSDPHRNTMLGVNYVHVGAGAGESGGVWRYTVVAGYVAGGSYDPGSGPRAPSGPRINPVKVATPNPDGSVVHTVAAGQTLWTIAAVYGVELQELMALNGFTSGPLLRPGDEVLVRSAWTPTPTASPSPTSSRTPWPTLRATAKPSRTPTETPAPAAAAWRFTLPERPISRALIAVGALLMVTGLFFGLRQRS